MSWEPIDSDHRMYGVFADEYSLRPWAIFPSSEDAERWIRYLTKELPEDERTNMDLGVLEVRKLEGFAWNSYDEPEGEP